MEHKPLDLSVLQGIFDGDAAGVAEFLVELSGTVDRVEIKIVEAHRREDWVATRHALHEMKGMCASSGGTEVAELCLPAEVALDAQRYAEVSEFIKALPAACGRLRSAISAATAPEKACPAA
jgi:HPt (histidine-containing phosphotransfer) domain-containing protein